MGRSPCCDKVGLKKGPWTPEEDQKLLTYIEEHGHGSWRALPAKAGLQRCGKSCRLRWTNYLRPDIKRGKFSLQEEQTIIQLHALLGNRWSAIATHLPKRTDNEIKNYWNTHLKKRLAKMGIDPVTHKPKNDALLSSDGHSKNASNLSHMAQWESARLEAEARLVRESKLRSNQLQNPFGSADQFVSAASPLHKPAQPPPVGPPRCLDILKAWNGDMWSKAKESTGSGNNLTFLGLGNDLESPTSTLSFLEALTRVPSNGIGEGTTSFIEFVGNSGSCAKEEGDQEDWKNFGSSNNVHEYKDGLMDSSISFTSGIFHDMKMSTEFVGNSISESSGTFVESFSDLLLTNSGGGRSLSESGGESDSGGGSGSDYHEDNKNYWNSILSLVNSSPSDSPLF